jgi:hypothetical protein
VVISLTASIRALSHSDGVKDLVRMRVVVLRVPEGGMGALGWEELGVCDVARKPVPGPILGGFVGVCRMKG